jgi:hypothetical protein
LLGLALRRVEAHGALHVLEPSLADRVKPEPGELAGLLVRGVGEQDLPAACDARHSGGEVDRRAEPVTGPLDGRPAVHADPDSGIAVTGAHVLDDASAELDGERGILTPQHQGVSQGLDLVSAVVSEQRANRLAETLRRARRPARRRAPHRRVAGEVGEEEGLRRLAHGTGVYPGTQTSAVR